MIIQRHYFISFAIVYGTLYTAIEMPATSQIPSGIPKKEVFHTLRPYQKTEAMERMTEEIGKCSTTADLKLYEQKLKDLGYTTAEGMLDIPSARALALFSNRHKFLSKKEQLEQARLSQQDIQPILDEIKQFATQPHQVQTSESRKEMDQFITSADPSHQPPGIPLNGPPIAPEAPISSNSAENNENNQCPSPIRGPGNVVIRYNAASLQNPFPHLTEETIDSTLKSRILAHGIFSFFAATAYIIYTVMTRKKASKPNNDSSLNSK